MSFEEIIKLLHEFDYMKNGTMLSIEFLELMIKELEKL